MRVILAMVYLCSASATWAQHWACRFDTECLAGEVCAQTAFEARVVMGQIQVQASLQTPDALVAVPVPQLETDAETIPFVGNVGMADLTTTPLGFVGETAERVDHLSISPGGRAAYTMVLKEAGFAATYLGSCREGS